MRLTGLQVQGKVPLPKRVAKELSCVYVDTGAMYRAMALYLLRQKISQPERYLEIVKQPVRIADIAIEYAGWRTACIYLNGENVTEFLRTEEVGNMASVSSAIPEVRQKLLESSAENWHATMSVVMDGRDIGTTILPDAEVKIYLTASSLYKSQTPLSGAAGKRH